MDWALKRPKLAVVKIEFDDDEEEVDDDNDDDDDDEEEEEEDAELSSVDKGGDWVFKNDE